MVGKIGYYRQRLSIKRKGEWKVMKKCVIWFMLLCLVLFAQVASAETVEPENTDPGQNFIKQMLENVQTDFVYLRSLKDSDKNTGCLKVAFPVYENKVLGKVYVVSVDGLTFVEPPLELGIGGSATIKDVIGKLAVGAGWMPRGYGWSWYVGWKL